MILTASFAPQTLKVCTKTQLEAVFGRPIARDVVERDPYIGAYAVTPSSEEQVLNTKDLRMTANIVVKPVPSNYGLITWNGSFLTVS